MAMKPESAAQLTQTIGTSGLLRFGGYLYEDPLPKGERQWTDVFLRMQNDAVIGALLTAFETLAGRVDWFWSPADESAEAQRNLEIVEECWEDMTTPWSDILSEVWTMLPYGWALLEQTYKYRRGEVFKKDGTLDAAQSSKYTDGKMGWAKWSLRSQETRFRWEFDDAGDVLAMVQLAPPTFKTVTISMEKALLFRTTSRKGNPEGRSILRPSYTPWARKTRIEILEGIGIERDLAGLPVMWVPEELLDPNASDADKALAATFFKIITSVKRDTNEGLILPLAYNEQGRELYKFELASTGGRRQFDTSAIIARYVGDILMGALADFLSVGRNAVGSYALIEDKSRMFAEALEGYLDRIAAVVNNFAVPRLLRVNGLPDSLSPRLEHGKVREIALDLMARFITSLASAGVPIPPEVVERLFQLAQLPAPSPDDITEMMDEVDPEAADAETVVTPAVAT